MLNVTTIYEQEKGVKHCAALNLENILTYFISLNKTIVEVSWRWIPHYLCSAILINMSPHILWWCCRHCKILRD